MIVVDTNILCYLYLNGEYTETAEKILLKDPHWAAPLLWRSEFRNVLALYLRKKILKMEDAQEIIEEAETIMRENEYEVPSLKIINLVSRSNCSAYDCEFVALAHELNVPLLTTDRSIQEQFPDTAVLPEKFLK